MPDRNPTPYTILFWYNIYCFCLKSGYCNQDLSPIFAILYLMSKFLNVKVAISVKIKWKNFLSAIIPKVSKFLKCQNLWSVKISPYLQGLYRDRSAWQRYHWKGLDKIINRYMLKFFNFSLKFFREFKVQSRLIIVRQREEVRFLEEPFNRRIGDQKIFKWLRTLNSFKKFKIKL